MTQAVLSYKQNKQKKCAVVCSSSTKLCIIVHDTPSVPPNFEQLVSNADWCQNISKFSFFSKQKKVLFPSSPKWFLLQKDVRWRIGAKKERQNEGPEGLGGGYRHAVPLSYVLGQAYDREGVPTQTTTMAKTAPTKRTTMAKCGANWRQGSGQYLYSSTYSLAQAWAAQEAPEVHQVYILLAPPPLPPSPSGSFYIDL